MTTLSVDITFSIVAHENIDFLIAQLKNIYYFYSDYSFLILYHTSHDFLNTMKTSDAFRILIQWLYLKGKYVVVNPELFKKHRFHGSIMAALFSNIDFLLEEPGHKISELPIHNLGMVENRGCKEGNENESNLFPTPIFSYDPAIKFDFGYFYVFSSKNLFSKCLSPTRLREMTEVARLKYENNKEEQTFKDLNYWHFPKFYQMIPEFITLVKERNWALRGCPHEAMIFSSDLCSKMSNFWKVEKNPELYAKFSQVWANLEEIIPITLAYNLGKGACLRIGSTEPSKNNDGYGIDKVENRILDDPIMQGLKLTWNWPYVMLAEWKIPYSSYDPHKETESFWEWKEKDDHSRGNYFILHHFGDFCSPFIIINHCLDRHYKTLFELGAWSFNSSTHILQEGQFYKIYSPQYLKYKDVENNLHDITAYKSSVEKYGHGQGVFNTYYGHTMNHDFIIDGSCQVLNWNFVQKSYQKKIQNFLNDVESKKPMVFINFTKKWYEQKISELEETLKIRYQIDRFLILIFVFRGDLRSGEENLERVFLQRFKYTRLIVLENNYEGDWELPADKKTILYQEIYEKFVTAMKDWDRLAYSFPSFKETLYGTRS